MEKNITVVKFFTQNDGKPLKEKECEKLYSHPNQLKYSNCCVKYYIQQERIF